MDLGTPVGTNEERGRTWPMYETPAFSVDVVGHIDAKDVESAEQIAAELRTVLDRYGVEVKVSPVNVIAEKDSLDEKQIAG